VKTFYAAGSETSSVGISWSLFFLSTRKEMVAKLRNEIDEYFVYDETNCEYKIKSMEDTSNLIYCSAVWKETLRLASPASMLRLELNEEYDEYELSDGTVVGRGESVEINVDGFGRDELVFDEPLEFSPERWLNTDAKKLKEMNDCFFTFGGGRRICPGMQLANVEGALILAYLVFHFDFDLGCDENEINRVLNFTVIPNKMPINFKKRAGLR